MTIKKLDLGGMDLLGADLDKFARLFPDLVTEERDETGRLKKSIDFEKFKARFSADIISEGKERYEFTWPGKRAAMAEANSPINKTLRPVVEESKNWDSTENLYIEGDNLEVLKLLQESYLGKIKMIYIDPPYNTGNDFVYNDDFKENLDEYNEDNADYDEEGGKLIKNTESNGRFHSDWCSMIYPRLKLARNLLTDDGVIFISIDDNEQENLKKICDEVFGDSNIKGTFVWRKTHTQTNIGDFARVKEYIYCYSKNSKSNKFNRVPLTNLEEYRYQDEFGEKFRRVNLIDSTRGRYEYEIINPNGNSVFGKWMKPKDDVLKMIDNNDVYWAGETPYGKNYLKNMQKKGQIANDFLGIEYGTNQRSTMRLDKLMDGRMFDFSKPLELLNFFLTIGSHEDSLILDFFSGFRVIIVIEANSYVNIRSSRLLPKFKTQKINSWCAA